MHKRDCYDRWHSGSGSRIRENEQMFASMSVFYEACATLICMPISAPLECWPSFSTWSLDQWELCGRLLHLLIRSIEFGALSWPFASPAFRRLDDCWWFSLMCQGEWAKTWMPTENNMYQQHSKIPRTVSRIKFSAVVSYSFFFGWYYW